MLGRRQVAARLHSLLTETPTGWSVRVGLLGDWGGGKTTVAKWAEASAEADGHLVVRFNPSAAATKTELWLGLAKAILKAADTPRPRSLPTEATNSLRTLVTGFDAAERTRTAAAAFKWLQALHSAAEEFLEVGPAQLSRLRQALGDDRRIVVVIDDIDRADPKLLPGLLLALRDVLDLPGYSFLLSFDERVVAGALAGHNPAWGDGWRFLDKILDFRVRLVPPAPAARLRVFEAAMDEAGLWVEGMANGFEALLPDNPRRIKALARGLSLLKEEQGRHRPDEIDWRSILYGALVRDESEAFFRAYVEDTFASGQNRQLARLMNKKEGDGKERQRVATLLEKHVADAPHKHERLFQLCDAWLRDFGIGDTGRVCYSIRLLDEASEGATWGDHDEALEVFRVRRSADDVARWALEASKVARSAEEFSGSLLRVLCFGYGRALQRATEAFLMSEHQDIIEEALDNLDLLGGLADVEMPGLRQEEFRLAAFETLLEETDRWQSFDRNPADATARSREMMLLSAWAEKASGLDERDTYIRVSGWPEEDYRRVHQVERRRRLRALLDPPSPFRALRRLSTPGGVRELVVRDAPADAQSALLDPAAPLWTPDGAPSSAGERLMAEAGSRPEVQRNARDLLDLLWLALQGQVSVQPAEAPKAFLRSAAFGAVWAAATATPLQYRMRADTRARRDGLIAAGADPAAMPLPGWLCPEEATGDDAPPADGPKHIGEEG